MFRKNGGFPPKSLLFLRFYVEDCFCNLFLTRVDLAITFTIARPDLLIGFVQLFWNHCQSLCAVLIVPQFQKNLGVAHIPFQADKFIVPVNLIPVVRTIFQLVCTAYLRPSVIPFKTGFRGIIIILGIQPVLE